MPIETEKPVRRLLVFRLSSLGDLVLSLAALESPRIEENTRIDWVVSKEFTELLDCHPKIETLWRFDRRSETPFLGWVQLLKKLSEQPYDEIWDLHGSLRTYFAQVYFFILGHRALWKRVKKMRARRQGLLWFRAFWPKKWHPAHWLDRFSEISGSSERKHPNIEYLPAEHSQESSEETYYTVMPNAQWKGKRIPRDYVLAWARAHGEPVVVLGAKKDVYCNEVFEYLQKEGIPVQSLIGKARLSETAWWIKQSRGILASDTGLGHLAQALGVPSQIVFGPTAPELGFGPWRNNAIANSVQLACRPCSVDGRRCLRLWEPYGCLSRLKYREPR